jgi:hypothetical protein
MAGLRGLYQGMASAVPQVADNSDVAIALCALFLARQATILHFRESHAVWRLLGT